MGLLGRGLIIAGLVLAAAGVVLVLGARLPWIGRLPGDLLIERDGIRIYVPVATCLLLSLGLSAAFWLLGRFR
ncbi:MAG TPA: DUF2905 domain-containing protein [bacterium]